MSILVLSDVFSPCPQSASQRITSFVEAFYATNCKVIVLAANRCFKEKRRISSSSNLLIYDFQYPKWLLSASAVVTNPLLLLLYLLASIIVILRKRVNIILVSVPNSEVAISGFLLSNLFKIPMVIDMRDFYPPHPSLISHLPIPIPRKLNGCLMGILSFLYKRVNKMTCANSSIRQKLLEIGVSASNVLVIPNGADASVYEPCRSEEERKKIRSQYGLPLKDCIFVYAGSLVAYYPLWVAIKGLKHVPYKKRKNLLLLTISYKKYTRYLALVKRLKLDDHVRFMGPLSIPETAKILSACDVGLVLYKSENAWRGMYGAKIFSYMACGLPILAAGPKMGVIKTLVSQYKLGVFVGAPTETNFARGFLHCVNNRDENMIMGKNAREIVEKTYDRRKLALKMAELVFNIARK